MVQLAGPKIKRGQVRKEASGSRNRYDAFILNPDADVLELRGFNFEFDRRLRFSGDSASHSEDESATIQPRGVRRDFFHRKCRLRFPDIQ